MGKYVLRRLIYAVATLWVVSIIIFLVIRILPGDPLVVFYGEEEASAMTEEQRTITLKKLGYSDSLLVQYGRWIKDIGTGKFGYSFFRNQSISSQIYHRGILTVEIAFFSVVVAWLVGVPIGLIGALRRNSIIDYASRLFALMFIAVPSFWVSLLIVLMLVSWFHWTPPIITIYPWENPWGNFQIVMFPALVLGFAQGAFMARLVRSTLLEVISEDYVRTARAKGLGERAVVMRHALRNALLPVVTLSALLFGFAVGGSVIIEQIFNVRGLGTMLVNAAFDHDLNVIQNLVLVYATVFIIVNLSADLLYGWLDPRIRYN